MIKFFRKIRQKLLSENKFSKYLIYAIGEIILVVIGILIAVQINNSYQNIKQKKTEIEILKGIKANILVDKIDINGNIIGHNRTQKISDFIIEHLTNKKERTDSLANALHILVHGEFSLKIHQSYFNQANEKGLSIISNEKLRQKISRLYEFDYQSLLSHENKAWQFNKTAAVFDEIMSYLKVDTMTSNYLSNKNRQLKINENKYIELIENKGLQSKIFNINLNRKQLINIYSDIIEKCDKLIAEIDKELQILER